MSAVHPFLRDDPFGDARPVQGPPPASPPFRPKLFDSFFLGGFECSTHRRIDDRRLDLIAATGHDRHVASDYALLRRHGIRSVRDGLRWHLIETSPGRYDFSSFLPMLRAAEAAPRTQVVWDLCHYGWPDHVDIWRPGFVDSFARYAGAAARTVRQHSEAVPLYCVVNEISYWSWAGGERGLMNPLGHGRGLELKHQLTRATIAGIESIRDVDPRARFVHVDPLIHVQASDSGHALAAEAYQRAHHDSWLLLSGALWPQLGGHPSYLDIVGLNYYSNNQWWIGGETDGRTIEVDTPAYRPLRELLADTFATLQRPLLIAETGAEGAMRAPWLRYLCDETSAALAAGVPVEGICLYPVLDYPGWIDERHCDAGLYGAAASDGARPLHDALADELARQRPRFEAGVAHRDEGAAAA